MRKTDRMEHIYKTVFALLGAASGWLIANFRPTFPLLAVVLCFITYDAVSALRLERRAKAKYPEQAKEGKFTSDGFAKVVKETVPTRLAAIILAYMVERWVFVFMDFPASYCVAGLICFEQAWSIAENESSCRDDVNIFWRLLRRVMIDKTARHLNVSPEELAEIMNKEKTTKTE